MADLFHTTATSPVVTSLGPPMITRLEPQSISGDPEAGLAARLWDPLWHLGRQWQLGEFVGEDAGTPLTVEVHGTFDPLVAWHPGATGHTTDAGDWRPLPAGELLESLVHAEQRGPEELRGRLAAGAAWSLLDSLTEAGQSRAVEALRSRFGSDPPAAADPNPAGPLVPDDWPAAGLLAAGAVDPEGVADAFEEAAPGHPAWWTRALTGSQASRTRAEELLDHWLTWFREEVAPRRAPAGSWLGRRLEYEFGVATASRVFRAPEQDGHEVGWHSFDLVPGAAPPAPTEAAAQPRAWSSRALASPLTFPGMPGARFWEMEDARIDLGAVWAEAHELARLLVVEAALVYGGDWLVVPLDVPSGGLFTIDQVTYRDTFGTSWRVAPQTVEPPEGAPPRPAAPDGDRHWRMFGLSSGRSSEVDGQPLPEPAYLSGLLVPPAPAARLEGAPIEEVAFVRDESANLVWAVELIVPGPGGSPVVPAPLPPPAVSEPAPTANGAPVLGYQLMTHVPETWTPYLPRVRHPEGQTGVELVRGLVPRAGSEEAATRPSGRLLDGAEHDLVDSAEVPRHGVHVLRVPVVARRADGTWASWVARRVRSGHGEAESGLRYDHTFPPPRRG